MFKKTIFITLLLIVLSTCLIAKGVDPLWLKAKEMVEKDWNLVPGKIKILVTTSGAQSATIEIHIKIVETEEGLEAEFIQGLMDGEEMTADNPIVAQMLAQDFTPTKTDIFFEDPKEMKLKKAKGTKDIEGIKCVMFKYAKTVTDPDGKEMEVVGTMYIDKATGEPVLDENTIFPLPDMVTAMANSTFYKVNRKGHLISHKVLNETNIEFAGQKMETSSKSTMLNHFRYTPPSEDDMFEE
jgi:hypothetical protein